MNLRPGILFETLIEINTIRNFSGGKKKYGSKN